MWQEAGMRCGAGWTVGDAVAFVPLVFSLSLSVSGCSQSGTSSSSRTDLFLAFSARGRVVPMDPVDGGSIAPKRCAWFGSYVQIGGRRRLFRPFACHTSS